MCPGPDAVLLSEVAAVGPGCGPAPQDSLDGAPVVAESPGIHVDPPQSVEEEQLLSG